MWFKDTDIYTAYFYYDSGSLLIYKNDELLIEWKNIPKLKLSEIEKQIKEGSFKTNMIR
jgi:hypothetical protein